MMQKLSILDRLELYAEHGETSATLKLWNHKIEKLRKGGFTVEEIAPTERKGEYYCEIDWKNPKGTDAQQMLDYTIKALQSNSNSKN